MSRGIKLLLDDHRGIYIPRDFVQDFDLTKWHGIDDDNAQICLNPDHEWYWEAWDDVLNEAYYIDEQGHKWTLWQDGALFALCDELMTDEDYKEFWGECRHCGKHASACECVISYELECGDDCSSAEGCGHEADDGSDSTSRSTNVQLGLFDDLPK